MFSEKLRPPAHSHVSDVNPPGPDKPSDACNPGQQHDQNQNLLDPEPELPGQVVPGFHPSETVWDNKCVLF